MTFAIGRPAPDFALEAYLRDVPGPVQVALGDYAGRWLVLFFYPADFTFICPTELREFAELHEEFAAAGAGVLASSTDGYHSHRAWFELESSLESVRFPVAADTTHALSRAYGVLDDDGTAMRGTFVIDPQGLVRHATVNDRSVGRSGAETLRVLHALQTGELCPADWRPGRATLGLAA